MEIAMFHCVSGRTLGVFRCLLHDTSTRKNAVTPLHINTTDVILDSFSNFLTMASRCSGVCWRHAVERIRLEILFT